MVKRVDQSAWGNFGLRVRPAPSGLEHEPPDVTAADVQEFHPAVREGANLAELAASPADLPGASAQAPHNVSGSANAPNSEAPNVVISAISLPRTRRMSSLKAWNSESPGRRR